MSDIQFDTDQVQYRSRTVLGQAQVPGMAAWLVKKGVIKDEAQAGKVLVALAIFNLVVAALIFYYFAM